MDAMSAPIGQISGICQKTTAILQELKDHERCYLDRHIDLHVPLSLNPAMSYGLIESVAWAIRNVTRKLLDPVGYFTEVLDRLVAGELVMVIDLCDSLAEKGRLREYLSHLIEKAGLQDTSPKIGKTFDPRHQEIIGLREGAPRDEILEVSRRGFRYKGRNIRKACVIIGR